MFAYCNNSPVLFYDPDGCYSHVYDDKTDDEALEGIVDAGGGGGGFANAYNSIDAGYSYHVDFSMASNSSSFTGGIFSNGYTSYSSTTAAGVSGNLSPRFDANQRALLALVKERKSGLSLAEAKIIVEWGREYGFINNRIDEGHADGGNHITRGTHLHIGPYNHIWVY